MGKEIHEPTNEPARTVLKCVTYLRHVPARTCQSGGVVVSRATDALLATVAVTGESDAANDEVSSSDLDALAPGANAAELTTWIDALALTLAAGLRVGATGLDRVASRPALRLVDRDDGAADDDIPTGDANGDVLSVDDVAAMLQVGRNAVYESVGRNEIPHRRIGKQIRFSRRGIMRWLDSWSSQGAKEGK